MGTPGSSSSQQHSQAIVSIRALPAPSVSPTQRISSPRVATPHGLRKSVGEGSRSSYRSKVKARKDFTADPDDPDEISFSKGEILDVVDRQGKWWLVQNSDGSVGIAPSDYFSLLDVDDRQIENLPNRSSGGTSVYLDGTAESGRSFSQEEIFEVVEKQLEWWKAPKPQGSGGALSSDYSSVSGFDPETFQCKAQALYSYTADTNDPRELSFKQGEILDIGDRRADWWPARNAKGLVGIAPSNYLQLL
ncbi:hypothetical protein B0H19DRAFT_303932 [Mycena capillaripes]|nr:hypothetical protein B0H19DRAFT_303932 [Mycena capillaripes]